MRFPDQGDLSATLEHFWHPVCALAELESTDIGGAVSPAAVRLLGRDLAIARLADGTLTALDDRCLHRSTRLSIGTVDGCTVRCAYHGWTWGADGRCTSIPSMPDAPIPAKARIGSYDVAERYGLVWVRLVSSSASGSVSDKVASTVSEVPGCRAWGDESLHFMAGEPYVWPVAAARRVENFVDLAHFAWVHDGSLGRRDAPVPPLPSIERVGGQLRFAYDPPEFDADDTAMYGVSDYRITMPTTVDIEFRLASGARRILWMTASPIDADHCRSFWFMARDDDLGNEFDADHVAFQTRVLAEDEPVVCNQHPGEFPLDPTSELSVRTDAVSIAYRRWVRELVEAYVDGGAAGLAASIARTTPADATATPARISASSGARSESSSHDARTASSAMSAMSSKS
jgi:phenylpropionate dioxygenase-like ring-hydroxylating dioxygenase large terminal subunit